MVIILNLSRGANDADLRHLMRSLSDVTSRVDKAASLIIRDIRRKKELAEQSGLVCQQ